MTQPKRSKKRQTLIDSGTYQPPKRKFGKGTVETLKVKAGQRCKRTISDYQFIEATYRLRADTILKNEP